MKAPPSGSSVDLERWVTILSQSDKTLLSGTCCTPGAVLSMMVAKGHTTLQGPAGLCGRQAARSY